MSCMVVARTRGKVTHCNTVAHRASGLYFFFLLTRLARTALRCPRSKSGQPLFSFTYVATNTDTSVTNCSSGSHVLLLSSWPRHFTSRSTSPSVLIHQELLLVVLRRVLEFLGDGDAWAGQTAHAPPVRQLNRRSALQHPFFLLSL